MKPAQEEEKAMTNTVQDRLEAAGKLHPDLQNLVEDALTLITEQQDAIVYWMEENKKRNLEIDRLRDDKAELLECLGQWAADGCEEAASLINKHREQALKETPNDK